MEIRKYNCKGCTKSCWITIEFEQDQIRRVTGNRCQRGKDMLLNLLLMD